MSIKLSIADASQGRSVQLRIRSRLPARRLRPCALINEIVEAVKNGSRTAVDITTEYLKRIEEEDERLGCYLHVDGEGALAQARRVDETRAKQGERALGFLAGVPIAVKDNICTKDEVSLHSSILQSSHLLENV